MPYEFRMTHRVEFADTDMAGIIHFASYFRYMEVTEHAFFRSLGFSIHTTGFEHPIGWPRVHADCDFRHPLRFEDTVEIHLLVREKGERSIGYTIIFRKLDGGPPREIARGALTVACVTRDRPGGPMRSVPIPREIAQKIEVAPAELLK